MHLFCIASCAQKSHSKPFGTTNATFWIPTPTMWIRTRRSSSPGRYMVFLKKRNRKDETEYFVSSTAYPSNIIQNQNHSPRGCMHWKWFRASKNENIILFCVFQACAVTGIVLYLFVFACRMGIVALCQAQSFFTSISL